MNVKELIEKLDMIPQEEGGLVMPNNYAEEGSKRADSGHAYYYFKPQKPTLFHIIDCDEYWIYHAGSDLEVWEISPDGKLTIHRLGISDNAEMCIYVKKGNATATRPINMSDEGTLASLVTVPRYSDDGLHLMSKEEVIKLCPEAKSFFSGDMGKIR